MNNEERIVKWKCPECGNYHKWVWSIYDIFGGETTMVCDNPECGVTSKMFMVVEKGGNATAFVADNSQGGATEIDISTVLIEGDIATIMGEKYKRIEEPKSPAEEAYKKVYGGYPPTTPSVSNFEDNRWSAFQNGYNASQVIETPQEEPEELKTLYQMFYDEGWTKSGCDEFCDIVKNWLPTERVENKYDADYNSGWNDLLDTLRRTLR